MKKIHNRLSDHSDDCNGLKAVKSGNWSHPWYFKEDRYVKSNRLGRRGRPVEIRCLIFGCNSTNCAAEIAIQENSLDYLLPKR